MKFGCVAKHRGTWPVAMTNLVEACAATGARMVFVDGLYMLGPQTESLREDMPLTDFGVKPAVRSAVTRIWMAATGRVRVAALRRPLHVGESTAAMFQALLPPAREGGQKPEAGSPTAQQMQGGGQ